MAELLIRFQPATGHEGVGGAYAGCLPEGRAYVVFIVLCQVRAVNDVKYFPLMFLPIGCCLLRGNGIQQIWQGSDFQAVLPLQHGMDGIRIGFVHLPKKRAAGIFPAACVRHIEYIMDPGNIGRGIHQGNSLGAAPHISAHGVVPQIEARTGRGVRPLGVDHQLLMVRVFVKAGGCPQEGSPVLVAARNLPRSILGHLRVGQCFFRHPVSPSF